MPSGKRRAAIRAQLRAWLEDSPDDIFLLRTLQSRSRGTEGGRSLVEEYARLLSAHSGDARYLYLYGRTLLWSERKDEAVARFREAAKRDSRFPWSYMALASHYAFGPDKDPGEVRKQLRRFWQICPDTLDAYSYVSQTEDPRFEREATTRLRRTLESRRDAEAISYWGTLWTLEFRLRPSPEHPAVRRQIGADLERLRSLARTDEKDWYRTLHEGYEMAGNKKEADWAEEQFLSRFAYTDDGFDWVREKWLSAHPYPGGPKSPKAKEYFRDLYGESTKWVKSWPASALAKFDHLYAAGNINELPDREVLAAVDDFLRVQHEDPDGIRGVPPLEFSVARIYLDRGIRVNRVPVLIDETLRREEARTKKDSDEGTEARRRDERNLEQTRAASWPLLAEGYLKLGRLAQAKKVVARMDQALSEAASKKAAPAMKEAKSSGAHEESDADRSLTEALQRGQLYHWKGRIAEVENHSADAWTYYRAGLLVMPAAVQDSRDRLESDARQLWKKLGGTEEGWQIALEKSTSETHAGIGEASGWQGKNLPLPDFGLIDLAGRRWTRAELKGKVSFINVWTTWCGPCQGELPHLQKLHEKLRGRSDVQLLTFNIDENPGVVEPFMTEHGYTFPALPAGPYVTRFVGSIGIPRNWIVNRDGTLISEQVGFDGQGDQQWIEQVMAQIDKALAGP